jgi:hypothetical protein
VQAETAEPEMVDLQTQALVAAVAEESDKPQAEHQKMQEAALVYTEKVQMDLADFQVLADLAVEHKLPTTVLVLYLEVVLAELRTILQVQDMQAVVVL